MISNDKVMVTIKIVWVMIVKITIVLIIIKFQVFSTIESMSLRNLNRCEYNVKIFHEEIQESQESLIQGFE